MDDSPAPAPGSALVSLEDRARDYVVNSVSESTRCAHARDWAHFSAWAEQRRVEALPASPETICLYLTAHADVHKPSTLQRRLASVSKAHQMAGYESPTRSALVRQTLRGIRRSRVQAGEDAGPKQKRPLMAKDLREIVDLLPETLKGKRDRAILLLGYAGGFRRSELAALDVSDLDFVDQGVLVRLRRSKTNQEGVEEVKDIGFGTNAPTCPVRALKAWLESAGVESGPVFRPVTKHDTLRQGRLTDKSIARVVKACAGLVGIDAAEVGGHSLRAGLVTSLFEAGVHTPRIKALTGHKTDRVLNGYWRRAQRFDVNTSAKAGL